jgi:acid phosphatase family membrane protein YuiD
MSNKIYKYNSPKSSSSTETTTTGGTTSSTSATVTDVANSIASAGNISVNGDLAVSGKITLLRATLFPHSQQQLTMQLLTLLRVTLL